MGALWAEAAELRERAAGLESRVADLAARVGQNSQYSSRPGIGWLEALTQALDGNPWIPGTVLATPHGLGNLARA